MENIGPWHLLDGNMNGIEDWEVTIVTILSTETAALKFCLPSPQGLRKKWMDLNCIKILIQVKEKFSNFKNNIFELDYHRHENIYLMFTLNKITDWKTAECPLMAYFLWFYDNYHGKWRLERGVVGRSWGTRKWVLYLQKKLKWECTAGIK